MRWQDHVQHQPLLHEGLQVPVVKIRLRRILVSTTTWWHVNAGPTRKREVAIVCDLQREISSVKLTLDVAATEATATVMIERKKRMVKIFF